MAVGPQHWHSALQLALYVQVWHHNWAGSAVLVALFMGAVVRQLLSHWDLDLSKMLAG